MRKAYDTFLNSEVSADHAAKCGGLELYRYECSHCGEEVRLAATRSLNMVAHFRHRSGNNDVECNNYLGRNAAISIDPSSRKSKSERAEFYFDRINKMFLLGLSFSENEMVVHEKETAEFLLHIYKSDQEHQVYNLRINSINFSPDTPTMIPVEEFSYTYFLSNTLSNDKREYELFKKNGMPTFFKIQGDNKARLIRSQILYTEVEYLVIIEKHNSFKIDFRLNDFETSESFSFSTMERNFTGGKIVIKRKSHEVENLLASWGYKIEESESLTLLWPPVAQVNEVTKVDREYAFLFSSFNLVPQGNTNVDKTELKKLENGITKVSLTSRVKIYRKNAEIVMELERSQFSKYDELPIETIYCDDYSVPDNKTYFLFNHSGAVQINKGQKVTLTRGCSIKRYNSSYLEGIIYLRQQKELTGELLLADILAHYKRTESFSNDSIKMRKLSNTAEKYLISCNKTGIINSAAKRFIEEGLL